MRRPCSQVRVRAAAVGVSVPAGRLRCLWGSLWLPPQPCSQDAVLTPGWPPAYCSPPHPHLCPTHPSTPVPALHQAHLDFPVSTLSPLLGFSTRCLCDVNHLK